jgi:hypothetical protein
VLRVAVANSPITYAEEMPSIPGENTAGICEALPTEDHPEVDRTSYMLEGGSAAGHESFLALEGAQEPADIKQRGAWAAQTVHAGVPSIGTVAPSQDGRSTPSGARAVSGKAHLYYLPLKGLSLHLF